MCADRDQANIPVLVSTRLVIRTNHGESSIFTSGTRVWLQGASVEASDDIKVLFQFLLNAG